MGRPEAESDEGIPPRIMMKTHRILKASEQIPHQDSRYRGLLAFDQQIVLSCTGEPRELVTMLRQIIKDDRLGTDKITREGKQQENTGCQEEKTVS